ncbi:MAG: hypothetical protein M5U34_20625 [Chloroflexi bacterium]|nr:hypothetical protein [Chloroflexota bacterium]
MATNQEIKNALNSYFSLGEINTLCFDLGFPYEDIQSSGKTNTIIALVEYAGRMKQTARLIAYINQARPHANLDPAVPENKENPSTTTPQANQTPAGGTSITIHGNVIGGVVGGGSVQAENIAGRDIIIGQEPQNKQEFQDQLAALEALLKEAIANGEIPATDANSVQSDVQDAVEEAAKEEPSPKRLTSRLEYVQEVLDKAAGVTGAAGKVGSAVLKAAPIVAGLVKAASILF